MKNKLIFSIIYLILINAGLINHVFASFVKLDLNSKGLCQVGVVGLSQHYIVLKNFEKDLSACQLECQYDSGCNGFFFSPIEKVCVKATGVAFTDKSTADRLQLAAWINNQWEGYIYASVGSSWYNNATYTDGPCSMWGQAKSCKNAGKECKWIKNNCIATKDHVCSAEQRMRYRYSNNGGWCARSACPQSANLPNSSQSGAYLPFLLRGGIRN